MASAMLLFINFSTRIQGWWSMKKVRKCKNILLKLMKKFGIMEKTLEVAFLNLLSEMKPTSNKCKSVLELKKASSSIVLWSITIEIKLHPPSVRKFKNSSVLENKLNQTSFLLISCRIYLQVPASRAGSWKLVLRNFSKES